GTAVLWDLSTGRARATFRPDDGRPAGIALSPDGKLLAAAIAGPHSGVELWETATGKVRVVRRVMPSGHNEVDAVAFSPDGRTLAAGHQVSAAEFWDLSTGRVRKAGWDPGTGQLRSIPHGAGGTQGIAYAPDGKLLATAQAAYLNVNLWDAATGQER